MLKLVVYGERAGGQANSIREWAEMEQGRIRNWVGEGRR